MGIHNILFSTQMLFLSLLFSGVTLGYHENWVNRQFAQTSTKSCSLQIGLGALVNANQLQILSDGFCLLCSGDIKQHI